MNETFEKLLRELTQPINGQYPRPWMSKLENPLQAGVFIVGKNQAKTFSVQQIGSHDRYIDALFNRNGEYCRDLYNRVANRTSPTRLHIDSLTSCLERRGISDILETNVICYSTRMSGDLPKSEHQGGKERGTKIFRTLLSYIRPSILIAHGTGTRKELGRVLETDFDSEPANADDVICKTVTYKNNKLIVFIIPSLAPPAYNCWCKWASKHLNIVADRVLTELVPCKS